MSVNNFITDLLDRVPSLSADKLIIQADAPPIYLRNGQILQGTGWKLVDREELLEDIAALGIVGKPAASPFVYEPDQGRFESMTFEIINEAMFAYLSFQFKLIDSKRR